MDHEDLSQRRGFMLSRRREAAGAHFRRLGEAASASDGLLHRNMPAGHSAKPLLRAPCKFEIYREDEIRLTATRFSGGDWHWRLSDAAGKLLLDKGGYRTEDECRNAVLVLKAEATLAKMPGPA